MFELYLPYLIALGLGMEMPPEGQAIVADTAQVATTQTQTTQTQTASGNSSTESAEAPAAQVTTGTTALREPEPQVATGQFTTALEVKPILSMTKVNWAAISTDSGSDMLFFSNLLAWRCGLWEVRYGINGAPADTVLEMEPCHMDTAQPNAMTDVVGYPIWVTFPGGSIDTLRIEVTFDDGTEDFVEVQRTQIVLP